MRKFITIMESITDESLVDHIAGMVRQGYHEGYGPYWKLNADPRLLEDEAAMMHISELISAGFTSGHHPTWDLKVVEKAEDAPADPHADAHVPEAVPAAPVPAEHHIVDEEIVDETPKAKHRVVPVHQKMGAGAGWWECPDEHAELFVVEDDEGEPLESYDDRNSADAHCHHLNTGEGMVTGEQILDEIDTDPTDNGDIPPEHPDMVMGRNIQSYLDAQHENKPRNSFSDQDDYAIEVAAIHERGLLQDEAFAELEHRGIALTPHQMGMAGR
jgi:hypothetical protein